MFRTEINIPKAERLIDPEDRLISLGSCFSELIGTKLSRNKFNILNNPFGTLYNPISIFKALELGIYNEVPENESYTPNSEVWYNYFFHSKLSSTDKEELKKNIQHTINEVHAYLKDAGFLIITLGSAFGYELKKSGDLVANCHKMPSKLFHKKLFQTNEVMVAFEDIMEKLNSFNPKLDVILTVSPVRHTKESLQHNSVSKSILRLFCAEAIERFKNVSYFPSYEIMMDDLRDYRFYSEDLIHPNSQAEKYIWELFQETHLSWRANSTIEKLSKLLTSLEHRPFNPNTSSHMDFLKKLIKDFQEISEDVEVSEEIQELSNRINQIKSSNPDL